MADLLPPWLVDGAEALYKLTAADAAQINRSFALAEPQASALRSPGTPPPPTVTAGEVFPAQVWRSETGGPLHLHITLTPVVRSMDPTSEHVSTTSSYGYMRVYPGTDPGRIERPRSGQTG